MTAGDVPVATALEEFIRFDSPLQLFERTATDSIKLLGNTVKSGQKVACLMGSANRDSDAFARADEFDVAQAQSAPRIRPGVALLSGSPARADGVGDHAAPIAGTLSPITAWWRGAAAANLGLARIRSN